LGRARAGPAGPKRCGHGAPLLGRLHHLGPARLRPPHEEHLLGERACRFDLIAAAGEGAKTNERRRLAAVSLPAARAFVEAIGGGGAAYAGPSSPMNKMIGVGFDGVPSQARLQEIEDLFSERGSPLQAEVAALADPSFAAELSGRGYRHPNGGAP
jgi:hypothetical protein